MGTDLVQEGSRAAPCLPILGVPAPPDCHPPLSSICSRTRSGVSGSCSPPTALPVHPKHAEEPPRDLLTVAAGTQHVRSPGSFWGWTAGRL